MNIDVTCREVDKYERQVEVYQLFFNPINNVFSMSYCSGDMWGIELKCPLGISPINFDFFAGEVSIRFDRQADAESFVAWLIEGEKKVQHGFETMRG